MERTLIPPILESLLSDPTVTDICFQGHNDLFFDRGNGMESCDRSAEIFSTEIRFRDFVLEELSKSGRSWDAKFPFVDTLFFGTHRAHLCFPPIATRGITLSLRRLPKQSMISAVERWGNSPPFSILQNAVRNLETVLIAGATGSGKTTLLNDLVSTSPPQHRWILLEDTPELYPNHPQVVPLVSRSANADGAGQVSLRELLRQTLRMRPDRIVLGECRGEEVLDLLQSLNTGHRGTLCTVHANSARDAIRRIELLALIGAKGVLPLTLIRDLILGGIQWIAHLEKGPAGRQITSILRLESREGEILTFRPAWVSSQLH